VVDPVGDAAPGSTAAGYEPIPLTEHDAAIATIVAAFAEDPVERWLWPQDTDYYARFPAFVAAFAGPAFELGTAWKLGDCAAVALWLGPGAEPDGEAIVAMLTESVAEAQHEDAFAVLEQMDEKHPVEPHWYLPWLAVSPSLRGAGLGSSLLRQCLAHVDASGLPAYLETPNPRTVPLYERHGFAVTGVAQAGDCPHMTLMLRGGG
jgi:ribosomal protein S18 acetylase RimI-like enzyme